MNHNRIKQLREEKNMTQVKLSIELEVSQETVSAYESGKHFPSVAILIKLSTMFQVSCDYILGLSPQRTNLISSDLDNDELLIITQYQTLSNNKKERLIAYLEGLSTNE